ncbi:hypothetical protein CA7LBN_001484 [Candidozyma auris]|uniref:Transcription factor domain-containing protein n=1 Tax=Candidozyma auris TaxID=498019 RepID=A0A8F3AGR4_CANAR|nr:hypothetical protein CA7LBN_001484 [[Candida] auris]
MVPHVHPIPSHTPTYSPQPPSIRHNQLDRQALQSQTLPNPPIHSQTAQSNQLHPSSLAYPKSQQDLDLQWKSHMEKKLSSFESKFDDLVGALRESRYSTNDFSQERVSLAYRDPPSGAQSHYIGSRVSTPESSESEQSVHGRRTYNDEFTVCKRPKLHVESSTRPLLTLEEAKLLFKFFNSHISQQLFGFDIEKFQVSQIWETSQLLVYAVCTIAAMHYPDPSISSKQSELQQHLHKLCSEILFQPRPKSDVEGFNIIVALILCSFWLSDSQRFTGLALQLAKEFGLNKPVTEKSHTLNTKDRLKLWYLLYVLDGQQCMSLNRQTLFETDDYSIRNSRELLLNKKPREIEGTLDNQDSTNGSLVKKDTSKTLLSNEKEDIGSCFTDLQLVSQVEYNSAIKEAFKGNAWDLIAPSTFGIPSKSNLELDKWMVSWTVLLAPINNGAVWSSKSTLIYYNFAKMHINCSALRELQIDTGSESVIFPKWEQYHQLRQRMGPLPLQEQTSQPESDSETDEEDELISNKELATHDQTLLSLNIAVNAAQTVLNLVLSDKDITNNLKYVPLHIHIMLYYAALLLVNPPPTDATHVANTNQDTYFVKIIESLRTAKMLQKKIYVNLPTDKNFGNKFIESLDEVVADRSRKLKSELHESPLSNDRKGELFEQISTLNYVDDHLEVFSGSGNNIGVSNENPTDKTTEEEFVQGYCYTLQAIQRETMESFRKTSRKLESACKTLKKTVRSIKYNVIKHDMYFSAYRSYHLSGLDSECAFEKSHKAIIKRDRYLTQKKFDKLHSRLLEQLSSFLDLASDAHSILLYKIVEQQLKMVLVFEDELSSFLKIWRIL